MFNGDHGETQTRDTDVLTHEIRRLPLDLEIMGRAITLRAEPLEGLQAKYRVHGDSDLYHVDLVAGEGETREWNCECGYFAWHGYKRSGSSYACKHICSALIAADDEEAVALMFEWLRRSRQARRSGSGEADLRMDGEEEPWA